MTHLRRTKMRTNRLSFLATVQLWCPRTIILAAVAYLFMFLFWLLRYRREAAAAEQTEHENSSNSKGYYTVLAPVGSNMVQDSKEALEILRSSEREKLDQIEGSQIMMYETDADKFFTTAEVPATLKSLILMPGDIHEPRFDLALLEQLRNTPIVPSDSCVGRDFTVFCAENQKKWFECTEHERELSPAESHYRRNKKSKPEELSSTCKTLWFSGLSEGPRSHCRKNNGDPADLGSSSYRMEYAVALASARLNAADTLQPVLMLGRYGLKDDEEISGVRQWAHEKGAIVIMIDELSFQENVLHWHNNTSATNDHKIGPYMRIDIPWIVKKYKLFDLPNICPRHILYTDSDVMFVNKITHQDMDILKSYIPPTGKPYIMYWRETQIHERTPYNTGIMLIDVPRFASNLKGFLKWRNSYPNQADFTAFDQDWFNKYFEQSPEKLEERTLLPLYWNWKVYWTLEPSVFSDIKVVHFHGPKPSLGAFKIGPCDTNMTDFWPPDYKPFIANGICCDKGKTGARVHAMYKLIQPPAADVC